MSDYKRRLEQRSAANRAKRKRLGCTPGARERRWKQGTYGLGMIFVVIGLLAGLAMFNAPDRVTGFDFCVIGLLFTLAFLEFRDGKRGPPTKAHAPLWARYRDGDAYVDAWEAEQRRKGRL